MANQPNSADSTANINVNRVAIKTPPFWKGDPNIWFAQIEAQFVLGGINNDTTKFYHVISAVDTEILTQVSDIIQTPPVNNKYDTLKARLVSIYTDSEEKKLRKLLSEVELGDRKPSTLLNEMQRLGGVALSSELLKSLWLQHLPIAMQSCLAVTSGTVEELSKLADKIGEIGESRVVAAERSRSTENKFQVQISLRFHDLGTSKRRIMFLSHQF
ncbi:uncharacterized protein LOC111028839 isoform X2 [Myzus persicae]|uniref:uncharacterized protein LOC111028839 isoform X2 n=1 Tax=Myzus persicae TaxID=13164 RepID=UPI000B939A33|nr:uncharacterized protein LOC111028839 isoform X2 [Myzus persicae]